MSEILIGYVVIEHDPEQGGPELATDGLYETALVAEGRAQEFAESSRVLGLVATYSVAAVRAEVSA